MVNGDAKVTLAAMLKAADRATAVKRNAWIAETEGICRDWYAKYNALLTLGPGADPSGADVR